MRRVIALVFALVMVINITASFAQNKRENRRFMHEFALYVKDRIDHEREIRQSLRRFLERKRGVLKDGFGMHPEILPEMFRETGVERTNCISGRYYDTLLTSLNNEERHAFYDLAYRLSYWVMMMAVEESVVMSVYKPDQPLSLRRKSDIPEFIVEDLKREVRPYLKEKSGKGEGGLGFDNMTCTD